jgi:hypothetical protein
MWAGMRTPALIARVARLVAARTPLEGAPYFFEGLVWEEGGSRWNSVLE